MSNLARGLLCAVALAVGPATAMLAAPPADTCGAAARGVSFPIILNGQTTVGSADNYNLAASGTCSGGGTQVAGTGQGADQVFKFQTFRNCVVSINLFPNAGVDLALYAVTNCASLASTCVKVSDASAAGGGEVVSFTATAGVDYYLIVDGSSSSSGVYGFNIVDAAANPDCLPVFFDGFEAANFTAWSLQAP
ncbi:MAG: hypothetical protein U0X73_04500 [Thermoanaerobaculia bacterium]